MTSSPSAQTNQWTLEEVRNVDQTTYAKTSDSHVNGVDLHNIIITNDMPGPWE